MPRIRTIKPEFWQNETLAGLSEHTRLLAIALLNHADDAGMFLANAALVRAACFPFEEHSKNVLGSLQDLSRVGYIEVRNCDGKQVGKICKFLEHQRIDKPQKSKLSAIFAANPSENDNSKNIPGTFQESSGNDPRLERKGKERNGTEEQGKGKEQEPLTLPPLFSKLVDYWNSRMLQNCRGTSKRQSVFAIRLKDPWFVENWQAAIDAAADSQFCLGENDKGWIADLEWFLKPDSAAKLIEGKYANRTAKAQVTFAQQSILNTKAGGKKFLADMQELFPDEEQGLSEVSVVDGNVIRLLGEGSK